MTSIEPTPLTWTLRLKYQKKTVVLHVNPLQTFSSIKTTLLEVLEKTQDPDSFGQPLPSSADEIEFGKPIDPKDLDEGFTLGEWERPALDLDEEAEEEPKAKGKKGRPSKGAGTTDTSGVELAATSNILQCPKGAGLKDGSVLVFRWGKKNEDEDEDIEMEEERGREWEVTIPSFDDTYDVGDEEPEGLPSRGRTEAR